MPAIERYTAVLYGELDSASLPRAARGRGADQVRIVSGPWGLVAPRDPIPHSTLQLSASLPPIRRPPPWWRPPLAPPVAPMVADRVGWALSPNEPIPATFGTPP